MGSDNNFITIVSPCTANCSQTLDDPNCEQCGIDLNNMTICTVCKTGYRLVGGQCQREGMYSGFNILDCVFEYSSWKLVFLLLLIWVHDSH